MDGQTGADRLTIQRLEGNLSQLETLKPISITQPCKRQTDRQTDITKEKKYGQMGDQSTRQINSNKKRHEEAMDKYEIDDNALWVVQITRKTRCHMEDLI